MASTIEPSVRLQDRDQHDGQREGRDGLEELGEAHQRIVDEAAGIAGDGAERHADQQRDQRRDHADHQRDPRAMDEAGGDVAAERVGAEREALDA